MRRPNAAVNLADITDPDATAPLPHGPTTADPALQRESSLAQGTILGRYVVLGRLGTGGAGSVFAAYDTQIDRRVALKVLHAGDDDDGWSQRWDRVVREARILGRLNHPNVVTVYDVDTIDDVSFIAMELVDGQDLAQWAESEERSIEAIVGVFVGAARGLAAAHAEGIVHGDFKPANVLVGTDGRARVSDFGVARRHEELTGERSDPAGSAPSGEPGDSTLGQLPGTPYYMAPEQHDGHPADPRSDIYALCLTLHETLYRTRPFEATTFSALAVKKEEGPPPPPSDGRSVPPWLRAVLDRGLQPDPARRFADVGELLTAIDRIPGRGSRWWLGLGVGAAGIAVGLAAWMRMPEPPEVCTGAASHLEEVWDPAAKTAIHDALLATGANYAEDAWQSAAGQLDSYAAGWIEQHTDACLASHRGEQSDELLDRRMQCLERKRRSFAALVEVLGDAPDAEVVRKAPDAARSLAALDECADPDRLLGRPLPADDPARTEVESVLARADAFAAVGKYGEALDAAKRATELAAPIDDAPLQAEASLSLGSMQARLGDHEQARSTLEAAHFGAERAHADEIAALAAVRLVSVVGDNLRQIDAGLVWGQHADAAIARAGDDPLWRAQLDTHLGTVLTHASRLDEAEAAFRRAEQIEIEQLGEDAPELAIVANGLGMVAVARKDYATAQQHYRHALEIKRRHLGERHPSLGTAWFNLGIAAKNQGRYEDARAHYETARDLWTESLGPEHPSVANVYNNLGNLAAAQGNHEAARDAYEQACEIYRRSLGDDHPDVAMCLTNLGSTERDLGRLDRSRALLAEALKLRIDKLGDDHPFVAITHLNIGDTELAAHDAPAALRHFEAARDIWSRTHGPDHPDHAYALTAIGRAHMDMRHPELAIEPLEHAAELRDPTRVEPRLAASTRFILARALVEADRDRDRARELAARAYELFMEAGGVSVQAADEVAQWLEEHPA